VSGDQLASLRQELGARAALLFDHLYPRMPRVRGGGGPVLGDASEHLVTIVANAPAQRVASQTFDSDPGKGMLIVDLDDVRLIDTHVSFGERGVNQVAAIAEAASEASKRGAIVVGDFNAPADALRASFGDSFRLSNLTGQRATRSATESDRGHAIDHVAVCGGAIESATVLESRGLSDHAPVTALVRFDGS
jgi:endonuclease/exonuclease/phosphatase family metal-dependent hydrolase